METIASGGRTTDKAQDTARLPGTGPGCLNLFGTLLTGVEQSLPTNLAKGQTGCPSPSTCRPRPVTTRPCVGARRGRVGVPSAIWATWKRFSGASRWSHEHLDDHQRARGLVVRFIHRRRRTPGGRADGAWGTVQNDIIKEYSSRNHIFPPEPSLKLISTWRPSPIARFRNGTR